MAEEGKSTVRAVERALDILQCFTAGTDFGMTEIADRVGLHKSTVHRMLSTLEDRGFVERDPATERYRLGFRVWELSAHLTSSDDPAVIWLPEMERLRNVLGETVSLYVRDGGERIRIQAVQSNQAVRRVATVGARLPLYVGASSKVLIAFADEATQAEIWGELESIQPTVVNKHMFECQMNEIRHHGYATSMEEREPGAAAVSAPIFDRHGRLVAALSISGPSSRLTLDRMKEIAPTVIEAAARMGTMAR
ncbi:transcriptional regulator, IclR family [Paenibacillus curdlanolyticus YK9]|uniref:Glycerol operon regulatory protein n=1 Tax=Paenibacillus curdlanolyticus YK9 TaxID=717606 RepID=E0IAY4_9BACL|nr:IclR family transcriptional regulator [Paenibacillus curdlanolyticus]EFM10275.1 transcriptional regulator, IclR family [Paenibacillus curdlanolyticus YK9]